jgi:hypothetical protein
LSDIDPTTDRSDPPPASGLMLDVLPGELSISRLPAGSGVPAWAAPGKGAARGALTSVSWTSDETSVVCSSALVPADIPAEKGWRALKVAGPLDLGLTGILSSLALPLADAGIALFAVSVYDTDYLLVRQSSLDAAVTALEAAGHFVR